MSQVYCLNINKNVDSERIQYFLRLVSDETRERIQKFRFKEDSLRTLYGEILIRYISNAQFGLKNNQIHFAKNKYGKPYIMDSPLYFNISHAGDWVVCAIDFSEIGIDIEKIKEINFSIAERFFSRHEYEDLIKKHTGQQLDYFYDIWTLKESYIKWLGTGLSTSLDSFRFEINNHDIKLIDKNHNENVSFKQYPINGYKLSVCSKNLTFPERLKEINVADIFLI